MTKTYYYAVAKGRIPGVYKTWKDAEPHIKNFTGARYKKFENLEEAQSFVNLHKTPDFFIKLLGIPPATENSVTESDPKPTNALIAFTDGSCFKNGKIGAVGGYSVVWPDFPEHTIAVPLDDDQPQTNNRAEYMGFLKALKTAEVIDPSLSKKMYVYTDSMLLLNSVTKWVHKWRMNNWKTSTGEPVKNRDLLEEIYKHMFARSKVIVEHVAAHSGQSDWKSQYNDEADRLAKSAASLQNSKKLNVS